MPSRPSMPCPSSQTFTRACDCEPERGELGDSQDVSVLKPERGTDDASRDGVFFAVAGGLGDRGNDRGQRGAGVEHQPRRLTSAGARERRCYHDEITFALERALGSHR